MKKFMKKNNKVLISLFGVAIVCCLLLVSTLMKSDQTKNDQAIRIAVFQPATHPALDEIAQGFIDTMQHAVQQNYIFDRYNGNGNKILMQAQAQEIVQKDYDLIFTIAVGCSVMIKDLCLKKHNQTPIVFTAVDDPIRLDLQGSMITGVIDQSNYPEQLGLLLAIKPSIKNLLLVYDQSQASGLEKDKNQIRSILKEKGVAFACVEILNIADIQQKVTGFIETADVIMVLKDNTVVSGIDSLIALCQRYHVPLFTSDLNSVVKGAALGYGIYEAESGIQAAYQAKLILEKGMLPSQLPIISVKNMKMKINCNHAKLQGLDIDCKNFSMAGVELYGKGYENV
ncbi:MAG: ABC transporter substrate-binding protein [Candidatus Dependentiae bacterium]|nr:ABC transporter substrate-binding protein [Candidatus Dependentiae bacterium]